MHELGLMDAVLRTVSSIVKKEGLTQVDRIVLEVGELSGVVPRFLNECYEAVADGTPYQETKLELEMVPGIARCNDCAMDFTVNVESLCCPRCQGKNLTPVSGKDLTIKEIVAC